MVDARRRGWNADDFKSQFRSKAGEELFLSHIFIEHDQNFIGHKISFGCIDLSIHNCQNGECTQHEAQRQCPPDLQVFHFLEVDTKLSRIF